MTKFSLKFLVAEPIYRIDEVRISLSIEGSKVHCWSSLPNFSKILQLLKSTEIYSEFVAEIEQELEQRVVFPLLELPEGPVLRILSFLSTRELLDFSECSLACKKLAENNLLWKNFFLRDFPEISQKANW